LRCCCGTDSNTAEAADAVDEAITAALDTGARTQDLAQRGEAVDRNGGNGRAVAELVGAEALEGLS